MRWTPLIRDFFKENEHGNSHDIKMWLEKNRLNLFIEELKDYIFKYDLGRFWQDKNKIIKFAKIKLMQSSGLKNRLDELTKLGFLYKTENIKGMCKYIYNTIPGAKK